MPDVNRDMSDPWTAFVKEVRELTKSNNIEIPPKGVQADLAVPMFGKKQEHVQKMADDIKKFISSSSYGGLVSSIQQAGPYLNFTINYEKFIPALIGNITEQKDGYGNGNKKGKLLVEFCHANTHKAFHIGHTRNIALGESISRILEKAGFKVIRANYQGDVGMHVAKTLWGMLNLEKLKLKVPEKDKGRWLGIVYAKASAMSKDEKIAEEVNEINRKLYAGDTELVSLWEKTRKWSIEYFENIVYPDFGVKFDRFYFESDIEKKGVEIAKSLLKNRVAKMSEGAIVMDLEKYGLGMFLILKSDSTPLYSTKDLRLAELENKEYGPDLILHVVGSEQNLYFNQLIKTLELSSPEIAKKEKHISYGLVILQTGKMASREGIVILYDDTLSKLVELAKKEIKERVKISEAETEKRAKIVALGAIKYAMLSQSMSKTITFDERQIVQFEGDTGPYLQYAYARAKSILAKSKKKPSIERLEKLKEPLEKEIAKRLSLYPSTLKKAAENYQPNLVASYLFDLATAFNEYYHQTKVIGTPEEQQRLSLVMAVAHVLKNALRVLGIEVMEKM